MPYIEIKLTDGKLADLTKCAAMRNMSVQEYIRWAALKRSNEVIQKQQGELSTAASAYAPPAYQMPYPARPGASGKGADIDRFRQMLAIKRGIDAELIRFAESILSC